MRYSEIKSIEDLVAEKVVLKSQIAQKEEKISATYTNAKAYYTEKKTWFNIAKNLLFRKTLMSNPISKFSIGYSIAKYLINRFKR